MRNVDRMLWVDQDSYFGPDRRNEHGLRLHDRRRVNCAGPPPPLRTALRRFRMRVLECCGEDWATFVQHAESLALLAEMQDEPEAARTLSALAKIALRGHEHGADVRPSLYNALDRAETLLGLPPERGH